MRYCESIVSQIIITAMSHSLVTAAAAAVRGVRGVGSQVLIDSQWRRPRRRAGAIRHSSKPRDSA